MMMLTNRKGKLAKWTIGLLLAMMAVRLSIFALAAAGLITWGGFSGAGWMWIIPVVIVVMTALMLFLGPRRRMHGTRGSASEESPSEILARRFARGELTQEQYEEMEKTLHEYLAPDAPPPTNVGRSADRG